MLSPKVIQPCKKGPITVYPPSGSGLNNNFDYTIVSIAYNSKLIVDFIKLYIKSKYIYNYTIT